MIVGPDTPQRPEMRMPHVTAAVTGILNQKCGNEGEQVTPRKVMKRYIAEEMRRNRMSGQRDSLESQQVGHGAYGNVKVILDVIYVLNVNRVVEQTATSVTGGRKVHTRRSGAIVMVHLRRTANATATVRAAVAVMYLLARGEQEDIPAVVLTRRAAEVIDVHAVRHPEEKRGENHHCDM